MRIPLWLISIAVLTLAIPASVGAVYGSDFMKGYNFPSWWHDSYLQKWSDVSFAEMQKEGGATWVAVGPFWYQKDKYATEIYMSPKRTASDASVEHVIRMAHEKGVKVMLKPSVDAEGGDWRGTFAPRDPSAWFASYTKMAVHYAEMATRLNVESYLIGGEYVTLSGSSHADHWRGVVKAVREKYKGQIGYGANWDDGRGTPEVEKITWWDAVDFIGVHAYFPLSKTNDAMRDAMIAAWTPWMKRIAAVYEKYKKPVVFSEAGYKSCDGSTVITYWCSPQAAVDLQEQSDGNESLLIAWKDTPWLKGIFWWMWNIKPDHGGLTDKDHNLNRKPVLAAIRKHLSGTEPTQSRQTPVPPDLGGQAPAIPPTLPVTSPPPPPARAWSPGDWRAGSPTRRGIGTAYGKTRLSKKHEKVLEKQMWRELKPIVKKLPKLKPGEWTRALLAYIYGDYPIAVIADALRKRGPGIHSTLAWDELTYAPTPSVQPLVPSPTVQPLPSATALPPVVSPPPPTPTPQPSDTFYGVARYSAAEEKGWEDMMWAGIRLSFNNAQPKLKPGEWTKARLAFTYGGYPIDVIREALHYRVSAAYPSPYWLLSAGASCDAYATCGIHPSISWSQWKK